MDIEEEEVENRMFYGLNRRPIMGTSGTKPVAAEIATIRNRHFPNLGRPLSKVLERLKRQGLLKPLETKKLPNPPPPHLNLNQYYQFHQRKCHDTESCTSLLLEIEDLIDSKKIPDPEIKCPNTHQNPFPNYHFVPPPT